MGVSPDRVVRWPASIVGLALAVALLDPETPDVPSAVVSDTAHAVGADVSGQLQTVTTWLAANPSITGVAYFLAAFSAWMLVRNTPWIDIAQTGTVCVTRASATLVLWYALAVECGGGVRIAPTLIILAVLGGGALYATRGESQLEVISVMLWEVFTAVVYVPLLTLLVIFPVLFGPFSVPEHRQQQDHGSG